MVAVLGFLMAALLGAAGWATVKILVRPGPRQEAKAREEAQRKMMTEEEKKLEALIERSKELEEIVLKLPKFEEPKDGVIPPDRMAKFAAIKKSVLDTVSGEQEGQTPGVKTVTQGVMSAQRMVGVIGAAHYAGMIEQKMSNEELEWIESKMMDAELIALMRLEPLTTDPDARKKIREFIERACASGGHLYSDEKEQSHCDYALVNKLNIPPVHIKYFLQYRNSFDIPYLDVSSLDWTPLLKQEGIQP